MLTDEITHPHSAKLGMKAESPLSTFDPPLGAGVDWLGTKRENMISI
jgi:hypothetical protein